ncbi:lipoprotein [Spiroplasma endosymbiont of Polydrusus pterygomalis]
MKKLLSLLSVLTISGTTMPSLIAANSYEKEEQNL